jgi:hypothetical protein
VLDQVRRALGHAAAFATRAKAAPLAGERHQPIQAALGAPESREPAGQQVAREELAELLLDQSRQPGAIPQAIRLRPERLEVLQDHPI